MVVGWAVPLAVAVVPCMADAYARAKRSATAGCDVASMLWDRGTNAAFFACGHGQLTPWSSGDRGHLSYQKTCGTLVGKPGVPEIGIAPEW